MVEIALLAVAALAFTSIAVWKSPSRTRIVLGVALAGGAVVAVTFMTQLHGYVHG